MPASDGVDRYSFCSNGWDHPSYRPDLRIPEKSGSHRCRTTASVLDQHCRRKHTRRITKCMADSSSLVAGGTAGWESRPLGQQKDQRRSIDPRSIRREAAPIAANLLVARPGMGQQRESIRMERTGLLGHGHPQPLRMEGTMDRSSVAGRSIVGRYGRTDSASRTAVA